MNANMFDTISIYIGMKYRELVKPREISNILKNGKIVILIKILNLFSRSRMTKRISPLESSREI